MRDENIIKYRVSNEVCDRAVRLRRELYQYSEIGFELDRTVALVRREIAEVGVPYTEEFGRSSIVCEIGSGEKNGGSPCGYGCT